MAKMRKKAYLPVKTCRTCGKPMVWRKSWRNNWDEVLYCSDRCRREARHKRDGEDDAPSPSSSS